MFEPSEVATLTVVEGDTATAPALRAYLVGRRRQMDLRALGIVEHEIGEDEDRPGRFAFFVRWRTAAAVESGRAQVRTWLDPAVPSFGATIRRYDGRVRAETSFHPMADPDATMRAGPPPCWPVGDETRRVGDPSRSGNVS